MTTHKTKWLLVGLVCLALWPAHASAQGGLWETYMDAATAAYHQGNYPEAEPLFKRALAIVEKALGQDHPGLATVLKNYAALLRKTGRTTEAAKMEARAKAIRAKHAR